MKKKYIYPLGKGEKAYTIDEIATTLGLDKNILIEYLEDYKDLGSAIFLATREKNIRKNIKLLLNNFTANYVVENGYSSVLKDYLKVKQMKCNLLKRIKQFNYDYFALTIEDFKLLLLNTEINTDKPFYKRNELKDYKTLLNITNHKIESKDINRYNQVLERKIDLEFIKNIKHSDYLCISRHNLEKIMNFVQNHKLPKRYNERIIQEVLYKKKSNKIIRKSL